MLKIEKADYVTRQTHPLLRLVIDGKEALIGEFKYSLFELGYVPLNSTHAHVDWAKILPCIKVPATETMPELNLEGFTDDPVILKMAEEYWKAINNIDDKKFEEGPIEIPER